LLLTAAARAARAAFVTLPAVFTTRGVELRGGGLSAAEVVEAAALAEVEGTVDSGVAATSGDVEPSAAAG
jgi:hypothetical protein